MFSLDSICVRRWTKSGILAAALGSWLLLLWGATNMQSPIAHLMMPTSAWSIENWLEVFIMWVIMMAAMMLPSAPMFLCFAALSRSRNEGTRTLLFVLAYLALWIAFSVAATAAQ